jgi:hypothetical protein
MTEIDVDQDGELDVDEFCSLMSLGEKILDKQNQGTYERI